MGKSVLGRLRVSFSDIVLGAAGAVSCIEALRLRGTRWSAACLRVNSYCRVWTRAREMKRVSDSGETAWGASASNERDRVRWALPCSGRPPSDLTE